jgi:hypothetical protein
MQDKNPPDIIIYNTVDGKAAVSLLAKDGQVWMNQNQLAQLFDTSVPNISMHISNILKDNELSADSVIKEYLTTGTVSHAEMEEKVREIYGQFDARRKSIDAANADKADMEALEAMVKNRKR